MPASTVYSFPVKFAVLVTLLAPVTASAWGPDGHQIVARVAELRLTPDTQRGIIALLTGTTNSIVAGPVTGIADGHLPSWADDVRRRRSETAPWHFVDIPFTAGSYDPARDCNGEHQGCVVEAIRDQARLMGDRGAGSTERVEALKFLVHFVGDAHQPLHCAERNGDKGGNLCRVEWPGESKPTKLHVVWDSHILRRNLDEAQLNATEYAEKLNARITDEHAAAWKTGTSADWAWEAHQVAVTKVYAGIPDDGSTGKITEEYIHAGQSIIDEQLMKGGVRLAHILNEAFQP